MSLVSLTELDRRIVELVSVQRVVTSTQLEVLFSSVPARTLRYRTERLYRAGLLGRSRPYRERGSAPYHLWPTRHADAVVRGGPVPGGGERGEPNQLFVAHAAGVTEVYARLATRAASGMELVRFEREPREVFQAGSRKRRLSPDALIELRDEAGRVLRGFMELDLGTMSRPRLKVKAAVYADYAAHAVWTERYEFCPCLLFLTTTDARATAFLKSLGTLLEKAGGGAYGQRAGNVAWFAAGACALAREPGRALVESCWDDLTLSGGGLNLSDCLRAARAPYDAAVARAEVERRAIEARREQLRADLDVWRALLQEHGLYVRGGHLDQFGRVGERALELLLASTEPMDAVQRAAFAALTRQLDPDPLTVRFAPEPVTPTEVDRKAVARLVDAYRRRQRERVAALVARYGRGPKLRGYEQELAVGGLLDVHAYRALEETAERDQQAREKQQRLRIAYLDWREREARRRKHDVPLHVRLVQGRAAVLARIDAEQLRICRTCDEIAYPSERSPESALYSSWEQRREPVSCHFCGCQDLDGWDAQRTPELDHGASDLPAQPIARVDAAGRLV